MTSSFSDYKFGVVSAIKPTEEKKILESIAEGDGVIDCTMALVHRLLNKEKPIRRKSIFNPQV